MTYRLPEGGNIPPDPLGRQAPKPVKPKPKPKPKG